VSDLFRVDGIRLKLENRPQNDSKTTFKNIKIAARSGTRELAGFRFLSKTCAGKQNCFLYVSQSYSSMSMEVVLP